MAKKNKIAFFILVVVDIAFIGIVAVLVAGPFVHFGSWAVLSPKGVIAAKERGVMLTATLLMLTVVIPVFFLLFFFAWKYRAGRVGRDQSVGGRTEEKYSPNMESNKPIGFILWAIPTVIIFAIAVLNWKSTHALDPYKPIVSNAKPITIQVVALQWKWLFIYPEQNIATINFIEFPANTPISFQLTADAPMNSFWIPELGGQMYAMPGMSTQLHLMANQTGEFTGSTAEISGAGFAGMRFVAKATSQAEFDQWVESVKYISNGLSILNSEEYKRLAEPSKDNPVIYYSEVEKDLYNGVVMKYMMPEVHK